MSVTRHYRADYGAAVFPDRFRVAGVKLRQLTLGHALLLKRLDSPFTDESEQQATHEHTLLAAFVCSMDWRKAAKLVNSRWLRLWMKWKLAWRLDNPLQDIADAMRYFRSAWKCPQTFRGDGCRSSGVRGTENVQILLAHQRRQFGKTLEQAMDTPVSIAIMDRLESAEENGSIRIWSSVHDSQAETIEKLKSGEIPIPKPDIGGVRRD